MNIIEVLMKLRDDLMTWDLNNLNLKVDKELGKGLSTNDYTTDEKTKLDGIETGAQVNTITGVKGGSESSYRTGNVNITASNIGLGNVDNTSDADKPVSVAQQEAIDNIQNQLNDKANKAHTHSISDVTNLQLSLDEIINAVAQKSQVQIITWGADD